MADQVLHAFYAFHPEHEPASPESDNRAAPGGLPRCPLARVIAIVGCDGAGKSTLSADLYADLHDDFATERVYLGQDSGNILKAVLGVPLIGPAIGRYLVRKSRRAHAEGDKPAAPDALTAMVIHLLSRWRRRKFRRMLALDRRGTVVITDRYPQAEAAGFHFDGPGLAATAATGGFRRWLAARERRLYEDMAAHVPALVIRLNIDAETAHARKPDHTLAMLRDKVSVLPTLAFNGAPILDLDARAPYAEVLGKARAAARAVLPPDRTAPLAGVVAVVGCDGSGKTRLVKDLVTALRPRRSAERRYMGLVSGETGDRIKQLPLIGTALERRLAAKVRRAQDMKKTLPGTFTAIVMYLFSLWRVLQVRRLRKRAQGGVLVIAERYPQAEVAGFHYDGPGLSIDRGGNRFVRDLASREQAMYERMAKQRPSLVIRLMIDADTAYARKPDHPLAELRNKTEVLPRIGYDGARIFEIDARRPYEEVLATALHAIERAVPASSQ